MESERPRRKLPVWAVVKRAYGFPWEYRRVLFPPLAVVTGLLLVLNLTALWVMRGSPFLSGRADAAADFSTTMSGFGRAYALQLLGMLASMSLVVGIHRLVLLGEIRRGLAFFRLDGNFGRYVLTALLLGIIFILSYVIVTLVVLTAAIAGGMFGHGTNGKLAPAAIVIIGVAVAGTIVGLLFTILRLELALPAAAVGARDRLELAWEATRGNVLRLLAVWFLTMLPIVFVVLLTQLPVLLVMARDGAQAAAQLGGPRWISTVLVGFLAPVQIAVVATMLSLCYDVLVRGGGPSQAHTQGTVVE